MKHRKFDHVSLDRFGCILATVPYRNFNRLVNRDSITGILTALERNQPTVPQIRLFFYSPASKLASRRRDRIVNYLEFINERIRMESETPEIQSLFQ